MRLSPCRIAGVFLLASAPGCARILGADFDRAGAPADGSLDQHEGGVNETDGGVDAADDARTDAGRLSAPSVLVQNMKEPRDLVASSTTLFWINEGDQTLSAVEKDGTGARVLVDPTTLGAGNQFSTTTALVADESYVYFGVVNCSSSHSFVARVHADGTARTSQWQELTGESCQTVARRLAIDGANVYATTTNAGTGRGVWQVPKDGTPTSRIILSGQADDSLASTGTSILFASRAANAVFVWDRGPGLPRSFADSQPSPTAVIVDETHAYWTTDTTVSRLPVLGDGGAPEPVAKGQASPTRLAADATNVYWTNVADGTVRGWPKAGGAPFVVADMQKEPYGIVVDPRAVYWTNHADGTIRKADKVP